MHELHHTCIVYSIEMRWEEYTWIHMYTCLEGGLCAVQYLPKLICQSEISSNTCNIKKVSSNTCNINKSIKWYSGSGQKVWSNTLSGEVSGHTRILKKKTVELCRLDQGSIMIMSSTPESALNSSRHVRMCYVGVEWNFPILYYIYIY